MAEYLAPGVYVEEFDSGAVPIEGVSTSTTGFVGVTERGPLQPKLVTSWNEYVQVYGDHIGVGRSYLPYAVQGYFTNGGKRAYIARVTHPEAKPATSEELGNGLAVEAVGPGAWGNCVRIHVARAATWRDEAPQYAVEVLLFRTPAEAAAEDGKHDPVRIETFDGMVSKAGLSNSLAGVVTAGSSLVRVTGGAEAIDAPAEKDKGHYQRRGMALQNGVDGGDVDGEAFQGREVVQDAVRFRTGFDGIAEIEDVSLLCVPDAVRYQIEGKVREQCELLKYRFGVLSFSKDQVDPANLHTEFDSSYTAIYTPWVRVYDSVSKNWELVPPVGHVAGVYARTDIERGVHKAPANEALRGIMVKDRGTVKPLERTFTKGHQDVLNPKGINVIRDFRPQGRGILVWGARTMSSNGLWKYVNVRRLFIFVEASLDKGTQWVVFEPNDEPTWTRLVASVTAFLTRVWKSGALMGSTEQEAFYVRCDRTTMTQDDIDNGRLVCQIGIAPVKPAEFVILRITQKTATAES